jgi:hypothetical protein
MYYILISLFSMSSVVRAEPVKWNTAIEKVSKDEVILVFTAQIESGWNIYSQYLANDDGPVRTSFIYDQAFQSSLLGKNEETGDIDKSYDDMFAMEVIKIKTKGIFKQKVKIKDLTKPITGYIEFMCCNHEQCLPPKKIPFNFDISKI